MTHFVMGDMTLYFNEIAYHAPPGNLKPVDEM